MSVSVQTRSALSASNHPKLRLQNPSSQSSFRSIRHGQYKPIHPIHIPTLSMQHIHLHKHTHGAFSTKVMLDLRRLAYISGLHITGHIMSERCAPLASSLITSCQNKESLKECVLFTTTRQQECISSRVAAAHHTVEGFLWAKRFPKAAVPSRFDADFFSIRSQTPCLNPLVSVWVGGSRRRPGRLHGRLTRQRRSAEQRESTCAGASQAGASDPPAAF
ncbi:unnamed protein product [Protopolystoma xenopodis]|uniref:Uncharacterized protein n=1 Tax=Protopolystoma xenopodis TaxID=117903 RepID=A0A3S5BS74_9PLAT|nr:unnamed protein product [Protopolystoma xenopodis]